MEPVPEPDEHDCNEPMSAEEEEETEKARDTQMQDAADPDDSRENKPPVASREDPNASEACTGVDATKQPKSRKKKKLLPVKSDDNEFNAQIADALGEAEPMAAVVAATPIARRTRQRKPMAAAMR